MIDFSNNNNGRSQWRSATSYILVTIGAVVGLGNIIQFPYFVAEYGGLFVLFYVLSELLISIPLFLSELMIGFRGKQNPVGAMGLVSIEAGANRHWRAVGWLCVLIAWLTLGYYTVQAAFPLGYLLGSVSALFTYGASEPTPIIVHDNLLLSFGVLEIFFIAFLLMTMLVVWRGINRGLEAISFIVVPTYFVILLGLAIYACITGNVSASVSALTDLTPNHSILTVLFAAMAYAFFKLNVGMGTMIVYGSYLPFTATLGKSTAIIVLFDAIISLLSYFVIYPFMLNSGTFHGQLNNHTVIYIFSSMPNGILVATLFFLAAVLAAWTSTIAMAETVVVTLIERLGLTRLRATCWVFLAALVVGSFVALTYTDWMRVVVLQSIPLQTVIRVMTNDLLTPLSAMLIAIFVGWVVNKRITQATLEFSSGLFRLWLFLVRYLVPVAIFLVVMGAWVVS